MGEGSENFEKGHFDYWLLFVTILLVALGIIMIFSSSAILAKERYGDGYYFLKKELLFVCVGFGLLFLTLKTDYHFYKKIVYPLLILVVAILVLAFIPGFKTVTSGAARWVHVGPVRFQPSELAKLMVVIFMAYSLEKKSQKMHTFMAGYLPHIIFAGVVVVIVLAQKDFGAAVTIALLVGIMMFVGGAKINYLAATVLASLPAVYILIASAGYRRQRILAYLDPWSDRYGSGFQIIQSLVSFNQGGIIGRGLGEGQQKLFYLPEAHTDFIVSVLGEELGLVGVMLLICLFGVFCYRGFRIASQAPDVFGKYLAMGMTLLITLQVIFNLSVVMGLLPTKGMVLPFVSYGGSALLVMLAAVGMLLNISSFKKGT